MKSVVMIAYFFPPEGSAGTYRPLRFVRHLAKNGWRTSVIAADPYRYERYDPDLLSSVPSETEVVRVRARDPWQALQAWREQRFNESVSGVSLKVADQMRAAQYRPLRSLVRTAVRTAEACFYQPDLAKYWIPPAVEATTELCRRQHADVIWATAGPVSAWLVARQASHRVGVPYVLDLRDPHGLSYYDEEIRRPSWVQHKNWHNMYQLFRRARSVVFLFDSVAESYCRAFPGALDPNKIHIIPNGYEGTIEAFTPPDEPKLTILYTGTLSSYRYDTFLQALAMLKKTDPTRANKFRFRFVGENMEDLAKQSATFGLSDMVETTGPTSYAEINRLQQQSHALLVFGRPSTVRGYELVAGAKLFNYLKVRRPILGVLPADETKKVLKGLGMSTIADVESPQDIVALLRRVLEAWSTKSMSSLLPDPSACEVYSAERQTAALSRALEGVAMEQPFVPGSRELPPSLQARFAR
jgi:hypothetical protein